MNQYSDFRSCTHARPVKTMRCMRGHLGCPVTPCPDYVDCTVKREPTRHAWIKETNRYFKRNSNGIYEKGIITNGVTYVFSVRFDSVLGWRLGVDRNGEPVCTTARFTKIRYAIYAGCDIVRHLIAEDLRTGAQP